MIQPPSSLSGTSGQPITIRALNDGQVTIDAQNGNFAVLLGGTGSSGSQYIVIDGINAKNGREALYRIRGSNNTLRRVIGWNGTSGMSNSYIFSVTGVNNRVEDGAGWGMNARKIFDGAQNGNAGGGGFRRCWGEWNDHPQGVPNPNNTFQLGYNTQNQIFENIIATQRALDDVGDMEGSIGIFSNPTDGPNSISPTKLLGSIFYVTPGTSHPGEAVIRSGSISNMYAKDIVAYVPPTGYSSQRPAWFISCNSPHPPCTNNVMDNLLVIHGGTALLNQSGSGYSLPNLKQGQGLAAATGGVSPFVLLPGICTRYVNGVLTSTPLWPWPMNQRILDARSAGGFASVNVTTAMESFFGTIPPQCRSDSGVVPPEPNITDGHAEPGKETGRYGGFKLLPVEECDSACLLRMWMEQYPEHRRRHHAKDHDRIAQQ